MGEGEGKLHTKISCIQVSEVEFLDYFFNVNNVHLFSQETVFCKFSSIESFVEEKLLFRGLILCFHIIK